MQILGSVFSYQGVIIVEILPFIVSMYVSALLGHIFSERHVCRIMNIKTYTHRKVLMVLRVLERSSDYPGEVHM